MHPTLISIGNFPLHTYGACMAIGFLLALKVAERLSGRKDIPNLMVWLLLSGVIGSRIAYVIEHWGREFAAHPLRILRLDQGGLMFYGGMILATIVFFAWCRTRRESALSLADLLCTVLPLGHAFGRIGCFFYGCCYGRVSDSFLAVSFPMHSPVWYGQFEAKLIAATATRSLPVLPTQLFEAAALLAVFALLLRFHRRLAVRPGLITGLYMIGYAAIRFSIECLRGDPRAAFWGLSIGQVISCGLAATGMVFALWGRIWPWRRETT